MDAHGFLTALWGDDPPGAIQLWEMATKRSGYVSGVGPGSAMEDVLDGQSDIYTAVGLAAEPLGPHVRAKAADVVALAGLWLDIDIDNDGRKADGVPTREAAMELAGAFLPPTLVVDSGYGVHAWHLFEGGPWVFDDPRDQEAAARMAWQWYAMHRKYCEVFGWYLGGTHDLARLLRIPGTVNAKRIPAVPVRVVEHAGPRHMRRDLSRLCARAGTPTVTVSGDIGDVDTEAEDMPTWIERLLRNARGVRMAFAHDPDHPGWTTSTWDLALATRAAEPRLGLTDPQIAELLVCHRHRCAGAKPLRQKKSSYLQDTVDKARSRTR